MMKWFKHSADQASPAPARITRMRTEADLTSALETSDERPVVIYKHSTTCGVSLWARREIQQLANPDDPPVFEVVVQEARPLSNAIAQHFQIRHESPQAIVVKDGTAVYNTSHGGVRAASLRQAVEHA